MAGEPVGIGEVARRTGLDTDTIRYYERTGVLPSPDRDASGRRTYTQAQIHLVEVLMHLRGTGMALSRIAEFTRHVAADPEQVPERLDLLLEHRDGVEAQMASWQRALAIIDGKISDYRARLQDTAGSRSPRVPGTVFE